MENLKYTKVEDLVEFLKIIGYEWHGEILDNNLFRIGLIEDFQDVICLKLKKQDHDENLRADVTDYNFYLEDKSLNQKFNFNDYSTMWQAFMIQNKDEQYANLLYEKTIEAKKEAEKMHNEKIKLTQKLLDHLKYEKSLEIAKYNTTIYNAKQKLKKITSTKSEQNEKTI